MFKQALLATAATIAVIGAVTAPAASMAQENPAPVAISAAAETELPAEVLAAMASSPQTSSVMPVSGVERFPDQVLKVDELVFQPNSTLELSGTGYPWVAIVAKRIRFVDPMVGATIRRDSALVGASAGTAGSPGGAGSSGSGSGANGNAGGVGSAGGPGGTLQMPTVYIYAQRIEAAGTPGPLHLAKLTLDFQGLNGGPGGTGGVGGRGGSGVGGRGGSDGPFHCRRGGQNGGDGGAGGKGGVGGAGGAGGNSGTLYLISGRDGTDLLSAADIRVRGGSGGSGGAGGRGGAGGGGGSGGSGSHFCHGGRPGSNGPTGASGSAGQPGPDGTAGTVKAVTTTGLPVFDGG